MDAIRNGAEEPQVESSADQDRAKRQYRYPNDSGFLVPVVALCEKLSLPVKWVRRETAAGRLPASLAGIYDLPLRAAPDSENPILMKNSRVGT
jgi:hypothetical protein